MKTVKMQKCENGSNAKCKNGKRKNLKTDKAQKWEKGQNTKILVKKQICENIQNTQM